jgi:hypothetical protein
MGSPGDLLLQEPGKGKKASEIEVIEPRSASLCSPWTR